METKPLRAAALSMPELQPGDAKKMRELSAELATSRISSLRSLVKDSESAESSMQQVAGTRKFKKPRRIEPVSLAATVGEHHTSPAAVKPEINDASRPEPETRHFVPVHKTRSKLDFSHTFARAAELGPRHMPTREAPVEPYATPKAAPEAARKATAAARQPFGGAAKAAEPEPAPTKAPGSTILTSTQAPSGATLTEPKKASPGPESDPSSVQPNPTYAAAPTHQAGKATPNQLAKGLLLGALLLLVVGYFGIGAVSDWRTKSSMSAKHFAVDGDMRPWMKTYNRHITRELGQADMFGHVHRS